MTRYEALRNGKVVKTLIAPYGADRKDLHAIVEREIGAVDEIRQKEHGIEFFVPVDRKAGIVGSDEMARAPSRNVAQSQDPDDLPEYYVTVNRKTGIVGEED